MANPFVKKSKGTDNPFAKKAKAKKAKAKKAVPAKKMQSPFAAKAKAKVKEKYAAEIKAVEELIEKYEKEYFDSFDENSKKFSKVDKLDADGIDSTSVRYGIANQKLKESNRRNDIAYVKLQGTIARYNSLLAKTR